MLDAQAVASTAVRHTWLTAQRVTGLCGIGFAAIVVAQNVIFTAGQPLPDASLADVSNYYLDHQGRTAIAVGLAVVNFAVLVRFASGFYDRLSTTIAARTPWPRMGVVGAGLLVAFFGVVAMAQAMLASNAESLGENPELTRVFWDLHNAAFGINGVALAIAFGSFARSAHLAGLTRGWLAYPAYAGALGLLISAAFTVEAMDGSPVAFTGLFGFLVWLLWLVVTGVRLLRDAEPS